MAEQGQNPGDGSSNPFNGPVGTKGPASLGGAPVQGDLKGSIPGEGQESEGGKWLGLKEPAANADAGDKSSFSPGNAT